MFRYVLRVQVVLRTFAYAGARKEKAAIKGESSPDLERGTAPVLECVYHSCCFGAKKHTLDLYFQRVKEFK